MTRDRDSDSFDMFTPPERGRFGDNESADHRAPADRVTLALIYVCHARSNLAIGIAPWKGYCGPPTYLPLSQITFEPSEPMNGQVIQVSMPEWLAKKQGLV